MHRLKEWFGIKDWQGPQPQNAPSNNNSNSQMNVQSNAPQPSAALDAAPGADPTAKTVAIPPGDPALTPEAASQQSPTLQDKAENWLKQYIPHKHGTCYSCKLVTMATVSVWTGTVATITLTKTKLFPGRSKNILRIAGVSCTTMGLSLLHMTYYDENPFDIFKTKQKNKQDS